MVLDKPRDVRAKGGQAVVEEALADLGRIELPILKNEPDELIVELRSPDQIIHQLILFPFLAVIFGSVNLGKVCTKRKLSANLRAYSAV